MPEVSITAEAKQWLDLYIATADGEISGLGTVRLYDGRLIITDIHLLEQECSATSTALSEEDVASFLLQTVRLGLDPSELKLWWHSHAHMNVFWSKTDDDTAGNFGNGWMLSIVGNKRGHYLCRFDLYDPVRLTIDQIPILTLPIYNPELLAAIKAEVAEKVTTTPVLPYSFRPYAADLTLSDPDWSENW